MRGVLSPKHLNYRSNGITAFSKVKEQIKKLDCHKPRSVFLRRTNKSAFAGVSMRRKRIRVKRQAWSAHVPTAAPP